MSEPFYQPGVYAAQVGEVALGVSSGGFPQIVLRCRVMSLIDTNDPNEPRIEVGAQYDRTVYLVVSEKSQSITLAKLRHAGWTGVRFEDVGQLVGKSLRLMCRHDRPPSGKYAGELTEKWDLELPPLSSEPLRHDPAIAKRLNALFGTELKLGPANGEKNKPTKKLAASVAAQAPPEDEVPF